jgi:transposase-like protein
MTYRELKQKAIELRLQQKSYNEIRDEIGVSKSTLSGWLMDFPLDNNDISKVKQRKHRQIERFRNTMKEKERYRLSMAYANASERIGKFTDREKFIAGLFLYWGEGAKAAKSDINLTNTNPSMLVFFIEWLRLLGINKNKLKVAVIIYSDMDAEKEMLFWSKTLDLPLSQFYKPRIKKSKFASITYKNGFGHGTCLVRYGNKPLWDFILMGIKRLEDMQFEKGVETIFPQSVHALGFEPRTKTV